MTTTTYFTPAAPARSVALARTFKAEWTKLRTLRSTWITVGVSAAASVALAAIACASLASTWKDMSPKQRALFDPTSQSLVGVLFATLILGSLAVRSMTSEYSSGMIRVTFAAISERRRVLTAKAAILAATTFVVAIVANVVSYLVGQQILSSQHIESSFGDAGVWRAIVFGALAVSVFAIIGLGLGTMLKRTAAATTTLSLIVIGGQLIGLAMPEGARKYLPSSALQAVVSIKQAPELLSAGTAMMILAGYAVAAFTLATMLVERRDA